MRQDELCGLIRDSNRAGQRVAHRRGDTAADTHVDRIGQTAALSRVLLAEVCIARLEYTEDNAFFEALINGLSRHFVAE